VTPVLFTCLSLSGWPMGENTAWLQERAAELNLLRQLKGRHYQSWDEVEAQRLRTLEVTLSYRARRRDTIELLDWVPAILTNDAKVLEFYSRKQDEYRQRLREVEHSLIRLQQPVPKYPFPAGSDDLARPLAPPRQLKR
jgi:hypothetical protein